MVGGRNQLKIRHKCPMAPHVNEPQSRKQEHSYFLKSTQLLPITGYSEFQETPEDPPITLPQVSRAAPTPPSLPTTQQASCITERALVMPGSGRWAQLQSPQRRQCPGQARGAPASRELPREHPSE